MQTILAIRTTGRGTWREMFGGMTGFAKTCDWVLQQVDARAARPDFAALNAFWKPAGWILEVGGGAANLRGADFGGRPAVAINPSEGIGGMAAEIRSDHGEIAKAAMGELLRLAPATLAFAAWFERRSWVTGRRDAARRIAAMHGMALREIEPGGDREGVAAIGRIADALRKFRKPVGVFAVSDDIGSLVLSAAARLGLDVPGDVAVVSVDDDPEVCENCVPALTSIRPDYRRLGFEAASKLHSAICGGGRAGAAPGPIRVAVPIVGLMRRASTVAMRRRDAKVAEALELIRLNACDGLTTARVVALFGTSLHTAEDRFKAATGRTIGAEIMERRFDAACGYLREGRSSVEAIAQFCGWNGAAAFRKAFRERFGVSPTRWSPPEGNG